MPKFEDEDLGYSCTVIYLRTAIMLKQVDTFEVKIFPDKFTWKN